MTEILRDQAGHSSRQCHFKPVVADLPCHRSLRVREQERTGCDQAPAVLCCRTRSHDCRSAVTKQRITDEFLWVPVEVVMQATKFDRTKKHARGGICITDGARDAQAIDGTMTTHKSDVDSFNSSGQAQ